MSYLLNNCDGVRCKYKITGIIPTKTFKKIKDNVDKINTLNDIAKLIFIMAIEDIILVIIKQLYKPVVVWNFLILK